jgi:hypothetical protein
VGTRHLGSPGVHGEANLARIGEVDRYAPDGHFKFLHLWPVKFLQAGRTNYQSFDVSRAIRAAASFSR